jgi:hypothetical protein
MEEVRASSTHDLIVVYTTGYQKKSQAWA